MNLLRLGKSLSLILGVLLIFTVSGIAQEKDAETRAKEQLNAGITADKAGNHQEAIVNYQAAIENDPNLVDAYVNLGAVYFKQGTYDAALEQFQKALDKDADNPDIHANLGRVNYSLRRYPDAIASLTRAIELEGSRAELYKDLGKALYRTKNYEDVIPALEKCHELGGGDYTTYLMLGRSYDKGSRSAEAISALNKSVELNNNYSAHFALGQIYMQQEKYKSSASAFSRAMKADKKKFRAAYNYASAAEFSDPEAYSVNLKNWENFVRIAKNNPKAKNQVAQAEAHIKELREAMEQAELQ